MEKMMYQKIEKTMENLRRNNMSAFFCETKEDVQNLVKTLIKEGDTVSNGGSETLKQTGVIDILKSGKYNYLDRSKPGLTPDEIVDVYRKTYSADAYFASCNAITENGELYNVDGNSNRVSAILFGPESVILICGYNKIVENLDEAITRVKSIAAPLNTIRLSCDTYCNKKGHCVSLDRDESYMCDGCESDSRVCCNFVVSAKQRHKDRIKVVIVGEELGY